MSESLRDTISNAVTAVEEANSPAPAESTPPQEPQKAEAPKETQPAPAEPEKPGRTAGRERDDLGRLLPGKAVRPEPQPQAAQVQPQVAPPPVAAPKVQRPSTWKKDHWEAFDKLATESPAVAQYILQREGEFAKGVSTYKQEWEHAKPLLEALAPYQPLLQQHNIQPGPWIGALAENHKILALGTPEQKLAKYAQLGQEYGIDIRQMIVQGQDGQFYLNPNLARPQQAAPQQPGIRPEDVRALLQQELQQRDIDAATQAFAAQKDRYPHYEVLKPTMAGILQAGLAEGQSLPEMLESAYEAALRHPRHADIFDAMQEQQRAQKVAQEAEEKRKAAQAARSKAASPRSASPTSPAAAAQGKASIRDTITEAFDSRVGGRV